MKARSTAGAIPAASSSNPANDGLSGALTGGVTAGVAGQPDTLGGREATDWLTRPAAATACGVSESTFRRKFENVLVAPTFVDGVRHFRRDQLIDAARRYHATRGEPLEPGIATNAGAEPETHADVAAQIFALLDEQVHPVDIVKRHRLAPELVMAHHATWARMRGSFLVSADDAAKLEAKLRTAGVGAPVRSVETLLAGLQHALATVSAAHHAPVCRRCRHAAPALCVACTQLDLEQEKTKRVEIVERTRYYTSLAATDAKVFASRATATSPPAADRTRPPSANQRDDNDPTTTEDYDPGRNLGHYDPWAEHYGPDASTRRRR